MKLETREYSKNGIKIVIPTYMWPQRDAIIDYLFRKLLDRLETKMTDQEINEAVARKLGGKRGTLPDARLEDGTVIRHYPDYCYSIAAAWEIMEHLKSSGHAVSVTTEPRCDIWKLPEIHISEEASTAPMAICLAFLKL